MTSREYVSSVKTMPIRVDGRELQDGDVLVGSNDSVWGTEPPYIIRSRPTYTSTRFDLHKINDPMPHSVNWSGTGVIWLVIRAPTANEWGEFAP